MASGTYDTGIMDPTQQSVDPSSMMSDPGGSFAGATGATDPNAGMPQGIDPRLWALFQKYGKTPTGAGTGNTDWQYWQGKINAPGADSGYYLNRLSSDFAGTGPDVGGGGAGGYGGGFTPSTPVSQWSADPRTNELYSLLQGQATQSKIVDPNDPIIRNQVDAFGAQETRAQRNYLADLAERGGGNANLGMERRMTAEKIGQDTAGFQAQLMGNELSARRQEIQQALQGELGFLSDQQKLELQNQLAIMDNLLGQAGLQQGAYQFDQTNQFRNSPMSF